MQEHVAELLAYVGGVVGHEGVGELVHLLYGVGAQILVGLLGVPGTFHAEYVERVDDAPEGLEAFCAGV